MKINIPAQIINKEDKIFANRLTEGDMMESGVSIRCLKTDSLFGNKEQGKKKNMKIIKFIVRY